MFNTEFKYTFTKTTPNSDQIGYLKKIIRNHFQIGIDKAFKAIEKAISEFSTLMNLTYIKLPKLVTILEIKKKKKCF